MDNRLITMTIVFYIALLGLWFCILLKQNRQLKKLIRSNIKQYDDKKIIEANHKYYKKIFKVNILNIILSIILYLFVLIIFSINIENKNIVLNTIYVEFIITAIVNISNNIYYRFIKKFVMLTKKDLD